ncbi:hypothetical protein CBM2586_A10020 [Cupriavidus phytorum]|uniref:Uncharacterized protein n=1 Tax=Cupriavidus taiwanensis TaxID=164546 RepID=A0A975ZVC1_9BURK|nr:hypothetical protein CBM2586_A10020 [Cupriavidus taiwanensis]
MIHGRVIVTPQPRTAIVHRCPARKSHVTHCYQPVRCRMGTPSIAAAGFSKGLTRSAFYATAIGRAHCKPAQERAW